MLMTLIEGLWFLVHANRFWFTLLSLPVRGKKSETGSVTFVAAGVRCSELLCALACCVHALRKKERRSDHGFGMGRRPSIFLTRSNFSWGV